MCSLYAWGSDEADNTAKLFEAATRIETLSNKSPALKHPRSLTRSERWTSVQRVLWTLNRRYTQSGEVASRWHGG